MKNWNFEHFDGKNKKSALKTDLLNENFNFTTENNNCVFTGQKDNYYNMHKEIYNCKSQCFFGQIKARGGWITMVFI